MDIKSQILIVVVCHPRLLKKPTILLVAGGFLIIFGVGLSVYGSQLIVENLVTEEKQLEIGASMELSKEFDPSVNENGIYLIQILDFKEETRLQVTVYDPFGTVIASEPIENSLFQGDFTISDTGTYRILLENTGERELQVMAVLAYLPQDQSLTISILGFIAIIIGLIGLAVGTIQFIRSRNKAETS